MSGNEDLHKLQLMEQSLQQFLIQKQNFQAQLMEIDSALSELEKTDAAYKIVGNIMVSSNKDDLKKDLESKKEVLNLRIKNLEKQEEKIKENASKLQAEIMKNIKK